MNSIMLLRKDTLLIIIIFILGCSAHSPFIVKNTTQSFETTETKFPPHHNKVLITTDTLPNPESYKIISMIEIGMVWYGSGNSVYPSMAFRAREIGADAVIEVKTWHKPSGWSWASPHGSGKAVKIMDNTAIDLTKIKGEWY